MPLWIDIFSSIFLIWLAIFLALGTIIVTVTTLRGRACSDWFMMVFTTMAIFNLLILVPFVQTSRLYPEHFPKEFYDVDRPWVLILIYSFGCFVLTSAATSIFAVLIQFRPSCQDSKLLLAIRIVLFLSQVTLPLIDVWLEWSRQEASDHCSDTLCRWSALRKDAFLCVTLYLWSFCVLFTLVFSNKEVLKEWKEYWAKRKAIPEAPTGPSTSEQQYLEKLAEERRRASDIRSKGIGGDVGYQNNIPMKKVESKRSQTMGKSPSREPLLAHKISTSSQISSRKVSRSTIADAEHRKKSSIKPPKIFISETVNN